MIFEIFKKKQIYDTCVYDPSGLAIVNRNYSESFTLTLIDIQPSEIYWKDTLTELRDKNKITPTDLYLKIYIPSIFKYSTKENLLCIVKELKKLGGY
jgi:hypothetical protein